MLTYFWHIRTFSQDIQSPPIISEFLVSLGVPATGCQLSGPVKFWVKALVPKPQPMEVDQNHWHLSLCHLDFCHHDARHSNSPSANHPHFNPQKKTSKTASYGWAIGSSSLELGPQPVPHDTSAHGSTQRLRSSDSTLHSTINTWVCFRNVTALKWYLFTCCLLILCVLCTGLDIWNQLQCKSFRISTLAHHSWELRNLDLWGPLLNICLEESSGGHLNSKSSLSGRFEW